MSRTHRTPEALSAILDDLLYHQSRILLLIQAVSREPGSSGRLSGLTKLAKLDFLLRYPAFASVVLDEIPQEHSAEDEAVVIDPMIRHRFGPWDDRYYPVVGALAARGLVRLVPGPRRSTSFVPTSLGLSVADDLAADPTWGDLADRCRGIARATASMTGNALKERIYDRLPDLMDRPHREVIT